ELVVIGSRHLGVAREVFTSAAVALPLTSLATCPVVVLREPEHLTQQPPYLVVGVDGSPDSAAAVDLAFAEADLRGAHLRALYVWHTPLLGLLGLLDEHAALREARRTLSGHDAVRGGGCRWCAVELEGGGNSGA
ncbi:universal stress protein, partial [Streptomyces sp. C1-2]|uniref:universal stress protein n=1 Tax=Streptomyces sp. C1-2 TaxID=2720022 RepID=UPI00143241DB